MLKTLFSFTFMIAGLLVSAQQNDEFRQVHDFFDKNRKMIVQELSKKVESTAKKIRKPTATVEDFELFMNKLDSLENSAYLNALVAVKIREDILLAAPKEKTQQKPSDGKKMEVDAAYPGGFEKMKDEIANLVYTQAVSREQGILKTSVNFVVEKDGSVSTVHAEGNSPSFNRQAEIAMYRLSNRFSPAILDGAPVRYKFRLPLTLDFTTKQ